MASVSGGKSDHQHPISSMRMLVAFILVTFPMFVIKEYYPLVTARASVNNSSNTMLSARVNTNNNNNNENENSSSDGPFDKYGIFVPKYIRARLPNIMIIGTQKAATSSIADFLFERVHVCRPERFDNEPTYYQKETHFFDRIMRYYEGVDFYAKRFEHCYSNKTIEQENQHIQQFFDHSITPYVLDATPAVLPHAERVYKTYQRAGGNQTANVKFMVVVRDPVARELSVYNHMKDLYMELGDNSKGDFDWYNLVLNPDKSIKTFEEYIDTVTIPNVTIMPDLNTETVAEEQPRREHFGMYAEHLKEWFKYFDRKQMLVISYDELKYEPDSVKERICKFLDIECKSRHSIKSFNSHDSPTKVKSISCSVRDKMNTVFEPLNEELYQLLQEYDGPDAEQKPFPKFTSPECE